MSWLKGWRLGAGVAGVASALALGGCEDNNTAQAEAKALWERVQSAYAGWASPSAFATLRPSETLHKAQVRVFFNEVMRPHHVDRAVCQARASDGEAVGGLLIGGPEGRSEWPVGSVIVKEGHDDSLAIVAVMEKRERGWFYAEYDASGGVLFSGDAPPICVSCHAGAMHDFTFSAHLTYKCPP